MSVTGHHDFSLRRSHRLAVFLLLIYSFALMAVWYIPVPAMVQVLSTLLVLASLLFNLHRWRENPPALAIYDGQWRLRRRGVDLAVTLQPPCYISRWVVVLPLRLPDGRHARQLVPYDSLDAEQYRRLKVQAGLQLER